MTAPSAGMTVATGARDRAAVAATGAAAAAAARETAQHEAAKQAQRTAAAGCRPARPQGADAYAGRPPPPHGSATASARAAPAPGPTADGLCTTRPRPATDRDATATADRPRTTAPTATAPPRPAPPSRPLEAAHHARPASRRPRARARAAAAPRPPPRPSRRPARDVRPTDRAADTTALAPALTPPPSGRPSARTRSSSSPGRPPWTPLAPRPSACSPPSTCAYSRFRPDSDLVRANRAAGSVGPRPPAARRGAERRARRRATRRAAWSIPPSGGALEALGYDRDFAELRHGRTDAGRARRRGPCRDPSPAAIPASPAPPPGARWRWTPPARSACRTASSLDLGAVGKAFAADLVAGSIARRSASTAS